ncbi:MAG: CBS domain-containing protein, partial [Chloroflexota bacterium]
MPFRDGLPIARVAGIEIRLSLAWVLMLAVVTLVGAEGAQEVDASLRDPVAWALGAVIAGLFLGSMIAHELAHALTARLRGIDPGAVVLGLTGQMAPLEVEGRTARDELAIAAAGPLVSLGITLVLVPVGVVLDDARGITDAVALGVLLLALLNAALAGLGLLPALPLDGGRIVRALAWWRTSDVDRASRFTVTVSRYVGWWLMALGVTFAIVLRPDIGIVVLALGWFISTGARVMQRRLGLEQALRGVLVSDALERDVPRVAPQLTLDTFADSAVKSGATSVPVIADDRVVGVVGLDKIRRVARRSWPTTRAGDVMAVPPAAPFLTPDDPFWDALELLRTTGLDGLAVVDEGVLTGMFTRH